MMDDTHVGITTEKGIYELFRIKETSRTLAIICAKDGFMRQAVYHDNVRGTKRVTHDNTLKKVTERRYSLHQNGHNPEINSFNFHLSYEAGKQKGKISHVLNTSAIISYDSFVPIFGERYGSILPNLKTIPEGEDIVALGPIEFEKSTLYYALFVGPQNKKLIHEGDAWNYEHIPRTLFDVHILWRAASYHKDGFGFIGFQPEGNWKNDEVYPEMKKALQRPLDDASIARAIMQGMINL